MPHKGSELVGLGLRPVHYSHLLSQPPKIPKWFEVITENFFDTNGRPIEVLKKFRRDFPIALHGVGMSLGATHELSESYLEKLKRLVDLIDPLFISDHVCWGSTHDSALHDLLPLPYTEESLKTLIPKIEKAQHKLKRPMLLENVSTYLSFNKSDYTEWGFLTELCKRTGSRLLLDVNNIYVNAVNHGISAEVFIDSIPSELIAQIHLAGHSNIEGYLFDTHSDHVIPQVWELFKIAINKAPEAYFMIEWDENIPEYSVLENEAAKALFHWEQVHGS